MPLSWSLGPGPLTASPQQRWEVPTSRKEKTIQVSVPLTASVLRSLLEEQTHQLQRRGNPPRNVRWCQQGPLPQGPWTPVLLGPYTDLPLSHCPRVTGYLFTELSSGSSCCRNQEGRRRRSLPSSRISPPAPPPSPPPAKLWAAAQLCPPAPGRTKDGVVPNDLEMRGTVPTGHCSTWIRELENCWLQAIGGKGFIPVSTALTQASTQGHFLILPASRFTPEIDGTFWTSKDIRLTGKGQRHPPTSHYPCILCDTTNCARCIASRALKGRGTAEAHRGYSLRAMSSQVGCCRIRNMVQSVFGEGELWGSGQLAVIKDLGVSPPPTLRHIYPLLEYYAQLLK
ncbi:uncharacterized protein LOC121141480 [Mesocricetus auratus]|uniref:Uncharacterized protein LOC121141480 n=1 Tax=Mesocricetus auratus TaxID=10036 RepID=A0ABM2XS37_MESAU|nr:uncharacterized protein LOC121141480 [Mesocricetus auratus]